MFCPFLQYGSPLILSSLLLLGASQASAAALGEVTLMSVDGDPLHAEIEIYDIGDDELGRLRASLASSKAFADAETEITPAMRDIKVSLHQLGRRVFIHLDSTKPLTEPVIGMLLELRTGSKSLLREYALIPDDQPVRADRRDKTPPVVSPAPATTRPAPVATANPEAHSAVSVNGLVNSESDHSPQSWKPTKTQPVETSESIRLPDTAFKRADPLPEPQTISLTQPTTTDTEPPTENTATQQTWLQPTLSPRIDVAQPAPVVRVTKAKPEKASALPEKTAPPKTERPREMIRQEQSGTASQSTEITAGMESSTPDAVAVQVMPPPSPTLAKEPPSIPNPAKLTLARSREAHEPRINSGNIRRANPRQKVIRQDRLKLSSVNDTSAQGNALAGVALQSEEDLLAAQHALKESNDRLAELEKNIAEMNSLVTARENKASFPQAPSVAANARPEEPVAALQPNEHHGLELNSMLSALPIAQVNESLKTITKTALPTPGQIGLLQLALASLIMGFIAFILLMRGNAQE